MSEKREVIAAGLDRLDELYVAAIQAFAPPNPGFERDRIIREHANKRELAYVCGFLSEGENEALLIFELMHGMLEADPDTAVGHLLDEARYYLRTSVDPMWQLDAESPSVIAAFAYFSAVLERRIARLWTGRTQEPPLADFNEPDARALLGTNAARSASAGTV